MTNASFGRCVHPITVRCSELGRESRAINPVEEHFRSFDGATWFTLTSHGRPSTVSGLMLARAAVREARFCRPTNRMTPAMTAIVCAFAYFDFFFGGP